MSDGGLGLFCGFSGARAAVDDLAVRNGLSGVAKAPIRQGTRLSVGSEVPIDDFEPERVALQFDGPLCWHIGGVPYQTLTQFGVKPEGESLYKSDVRHWSKHEAVYHFKLTLRAYVAERLKELGVGAGQIAWRERPMLQRSPHGDYVVRARLAVIKGSAD
jgi:hypothetical protein